MSEKSSKTQKSSKIARYSIDILAVYTSENETPIPLEDALAKIQMLYSGKLENERRHAKKCILQILSNNNGPYTIVIKAHNNKRVLECFTVKSMGTPQVGQIPINKFITQSLVFLPVLNKDLKSELFVFHPNTVTAQEIAIQLAKLMQIKDMIYQQSMSRLSPSPPKSEGSEIIKPRTSDFGIDEEDYKKENHDPEEVKSEYSLSSTFFNNWYSKVENMVNTAPTSLYQSCDYNPSLNGLNEELYVLNQNMKEIRAFMNNLYNIMHDFNKERSIINGHRDRVMKLPPKSNFIDIIRQIKASLNIATAHDAVITNPSAKAIVNQLLLILRIIGDATKDTFTRQYNFLMSIEDPQINDATVKYLTENLTSVNKEFWMTLGENYGNVENINPMGSRRTVIDEFQIRKDLLTPNDGRFNSTTNGISIEKNNDVHSERNTEFDFSRKTAKTSEINHQNNVKIHVPRYRRYESEERTEFMDHLQKPNIHFNRPKLSHSPQPRIEPFYEDEMIYHSYPPVFDLPRHSIGSAIHQRNDRRSHQGNYMPTQTSTWKDRQCRFIDAVRLRNGRLMRITQDRSAQNKRDISVSCNEVVELLTDYGDVFSAKNALGEIGYCPSSIAEYVASF